jgi:hypothetical protein
MYNVAPKTYRYLADSIETPIPQPEEEETDSEDDRRLRHSNVQEFIKKLRFPTSTKSEECERG